MDSERLESPLQAAEWLRSEVPSWGCREDQGSCGRRVLSGLRRRLWEVRPGWAETRTESWLGAALLPYALQDSALTEAGVVMFSRAWTRALFFNCSSSSGLKTTLRCWSRGEGQACADDAEASVSQRRHRFTGKRCLRLGLQWVCTENVVASKILVARSVCLACVCRLCSVWLCVSCNSILTNYWYSDFLFLREKC